MALGGVGGAKGAGECKVGDTLVCQTLYLQPTSIDGSNGHLKKLLKACSWTPLGTYPLPNDKEPCSHMIRHANLVIPLS